MTTFNYFYEGQEEQYSFFRIPKKLIKDPCFKNLNLRSKMLYGLMLDRLSLSKKNDWHDKARRLYIIYALEQIMEDLACSKPTAEKALDELENAGLIKRVRRGRTLTNLIYVMDFMTAGENSAPAEHIDNTPPSSGCDYPKSQKSKNFTSGSKENELQEVKEFNRNKTNKNNTKKNYYNRFNDFKQRTYNYEELEEALFKC